MIKEVHDPQRYGVAELRGDAIIASRRSRDNPKSNFRGRRHLSLSADVFNVVQRP